jgi:hypothetical protein
MELIMSIFSFLSKSTKTVDDIFDKENGHLAKLGEWVGNAKFTHEERAEMNRDMIKTANQFVVDTLGENSERSKSRREIARLIIRLECSLIAGAGITAPFNIEWSTVLFELSTSTVMLSSVTAIILFFFGTNMLRASKYGNKNGK